MKTCYYELLGVERNANDSDLKKAYRKMSLKFHPDKNKDEDAKEKFQLINEAYECLSNPNERTWYDNHRTQILSDEQDEGDLLEASFGGLNITKYMKNDCFQDFSEGKKGFYSVYRGLFESLKDQELKAFNQGKIKGDYFAYPGFGDAKTDPILVNEFYVKWENFTTYKNFSWADQMKNLGMQKELLKEKMTSLGKKRKKTFQKLFKRFQLSFKKKVYILILDPRYEEFVIQQEAERTRKQKLKEEQTKEKERQKKENRHQQRLLEQQKFQEEEELIKSGQKVIEDYDEFSHLNQEEELKDFYCQICDKEYQNANALQNHQQSKMHKKNLKLLLDQVGTQDEKDEILKKMGQKIEKKEEKIQEKPQEKIEQEQEEYKIDQKQKKNKKNKNKLFMQQAQQYTENIQEFYEKEEEEPKVQKQQSPKRKKTSVDESDENNDDFFFQTLNKNLQKNNKNPKKQTKENQIKEKIPQKTEEKLDLEVQDPEINKEQQTQQNQQQIIQDKKNPKDKKDPKDSKKPVQAGQDESKKTASKVELAQQGDIEFSELSKAKQKKLKKLEKQKDEEDVKFKCNVCKAGFPSKSKLFKHCEEQNHHRAV